MHLTTLKEISELIMGLKMRSSSTVMIHSSLLKFGIIEGGVENLLKCIIDSLPGDPTIVMPTPTVLHQDGEIFEDEGCLSLPQYVEKLKRAEKITMVGLDRHGNTFTLEGEGLLARAMQHEYDHIQGILMLDRLSPLKRRLYTKRIKKLAKIRAYEQATVG